MPVPKYSNTGPIQTACEFDISSLKGKSVVITGGAAGLGKAYAKAFVAAGAYVTIGDINTEVGEETVEEFGKENIQFTRCDVCNWDEQVALFDSAINNSPSNTIDIVIANAGLGAASDDLMPPEEDISLPPTKPSLHIMDVNLTGVLYTTRLALYHFRRLQAAAGAQADVDRCLILKSSMSAFVDWERSLQYPVSKLGVRGVMKCLRRTTWKDGIRINVVAPAYIDTGLIPPVYRAKMVENGMEFAEAEDCVKAVLRIATDRDVNGRSIGVVPKTRAAEGYMDLDDDYKEDDVCYPFEQWALNLKF